MSYPDEEKRRDFREVMEGIFIVFAYIGFIASTLFGMFLYFTD